MFLAVARSVTARNYTLIQKKIIGDLYDKK